MNLVTPKAGAKHELLFNEPASVQSTLLIKVPCFVKKIIFSVQKEAELK
jgi:hypothetical protein